MGALAITMFAGITALAVVSDVHMAEDPATLIGLPAGDEQRTAISQIGARDLRRRASTFFALQGFTAAILILAANTAFNGFPVLASLLGARRLPAAPARQPRRPARVLQRHRRCWRCVAALLIVAFNADVTRLIQLYILGVFLSFTLSQAGMVRHWTRELRDAAPSASGATPAPQAG